MAEQNNNSRTFDKSLNEDVNDFHLPSNQWTQARNAINNSITGDLGKLGNEPANLECLTPDLKYPIIGFIHIIEDRWAVFSTDGTNSEIGIFIESYCGQDLENFPAYSVIVNDQCLNFKQECLIKGVSRSTSTCTYKLYWDDGLNPSRVLEIDADNPSRNEYTDPNSTIPWKQTCTLVGDCNICENTSALDCDKIRLAPLMNPICISVQNGISGGNLLNGSYAVAMAYAIKGQKISDWYISNIQPIWTHENSSGSLDVYIDSVDKDYDEVVVAVIGVVNQQAVVKEAGLYSTRQTRISFDSIFDTWPTIPIEQIPIMTPVANKSDAMYNVGEYLLRVGPTSKEDFNYQPLANQIVTKWQSVEYPVDYYVKGNNNVGYMRDEVYSFFIQWIYDTGDRSASYHIPGRPPMNALPQNGSIPFIPAGSQNDQNVIADINGILGDNQVWEIYNTAIELSSPGTILPDTGVVRGEGLMGYWESEEKYPDDKPDIWNSNIAVSPYNVYQTVTPNPTTGSQHDLCGKNIRHHKFPEDNCSPNVNRYNAGTGDRIRVMGVKFENVKQPVLNDGVTPVPGIIGYRILRGTRNGNRSVIAKGIINNMHEYEIPGVNAANKRGLYPNYPYNDLREDPFLSTTKTYTTSSLDPFDGAQGSVGGYTPMPGGFDGFPRFSPNYVTFHSPETNFNNPFLNAKELRLYQNVYGNVIGKFDTSEEHPKEKLITDYVFLIAAIGGVGVAVLNMNGERRVSKKLASYPGFSHRDSFIDKLDYSGLSTSGSFNSSGSIGVGPVSPASAGPFPTTGGGTTSGNFSGTVDNKDSYKATDPAGPDPNFYTNIQTQTGSTPAAKVNQALLTYNIEVDITGNQFQDAIAGTINQVDKDTTDAQKTSNEAVDNTGGAFSSSTTTIEQSDGNSQRTPFLLRTLTNTPTFLNYFTDGTDSFIRLVRAFLRYRDYVVRYHSHGFYNNTELRPSTRFRTTLTNQQYINPEIIDYDSQNRINNLYRSRTVALTLGHTDIPAPTKIDKTRFDSTGLTTSSTPNLPIGAKYFWPDKASWLDGIPDTSIENLTSKEIDSSMMVDTYSTPLHPGQLCSSHYGALKVRIRNQYGQLNRIVQLPVNQCYTTFNVTINPETQQEVVTGDETIVLFGGDTYVNRYTEKNTFFFFYNWLYGQPDGAQLDYTQYEMIAYPKYWANFNQFQTSDFTSTFLSSITTLTFNFNDVITPKDYYALDGGELSGNWLTSIASGFRFDKRGWFYLFNSGVRDFFVESEINLAFRDYGALPSEKYFNPYLGSNTKDLFETSIIKSGNYYKYDISLSTSKLPTNYTSWANTQEPSYDPYIAETCFVYQPTRIIYSLPSQYEGLKDGWKIFLANNYYDFDNVVTCIKPVNKSGAMIFFDAASPVQFQGTDQLQTDLGTKLTIGDGGLFSQPLQRLVNTDASYEYASCQNRLSVINTPAGLYWISQNQGKIFNLSGGIKEISNINMKWWLAQYLPYKLTEQFPNFDLIDNPVIGLGCQSIYDNENGLIYFTKKDYILKPTFNKNDFEYIPNTNKFIYLNLQEEITLGDPLYFDDASWTISYDPKTEGWLGYHDWHPSLMLPGKNTFMTVNPNNLKGIWIHNERCDLYCNYYGLNYPFEVEFTVNTGAIVNSLRSIEFFMEAYKYAENCYDRFHVLDFYFDEATLYNTEQTSGLLKLNLNPKESPGLILQYPQVNPTNIAILFSKEENKYRFNQFWDITADRGEYNPAAQRPIWDTAPNGYIRVLNPNNLNYNKDPLQRKKFRHYTVSVLLRKLVSGDRKMLVMLADVKNLYSPR